MRRRERGRPAAPCIAIEMVDCARGETANRTQGLLSSSRYARSHLGGDRARSPSQSRLRACLLSTAHVSGSWRSCAVVVELLDNRAAIPGHPLADQRRGLVLAQAPGGARARSASAASSPTMASACTAARDWGRAAVRLAIAALRPTSLKPASIRPCRGPQHGLATVPKPSGPPRRATASVCKSGPCGATDSPRAAANRNRLPADLRTARCASVV